MFIMFLTPIPTSAAGATDPLAGFFGKKFSILGDSISTFRDYSNGAAADTTNSTIRNGALYYPNNIPLAVTDTWWHQIIRQLGLELLVNNSWSGSCMFQTRHETVGAYIDRCVQLHRDVGDYVGMAPDIIAVYIGTNDQGNNLDIYPLGSYGTIAFDALITQGEHGYVYAEPATALEAYAIALHKIRQRYPDAELYCFNLLQRRISIPDNLIPFNQDLAALAKHFGAYVVDLFHCGVCTDAAAFDMYMANELHPKAEGMDAITNAFYSALLANSKYVAKDAGVFDVSYDLTGVVCTQGTPGKAINGRPFALELAATAANRKLQVTVTMGSEDITASCYTNGTLCIDNVTGNISITATAVETPIL